MILVTEKMLDNKFNEWLYFNDDFVFCNENKEEYLSKFLDLCNSEYLTIKRKYQPEISISNDKSWYVPIKFMKVA